MQTHGQKILQRTLQSVLDSDEGVFNSNELAKLDIGLAQKSKQFSLIKKEQGELYLQVAISKIMKEALRFLPTKMTEPDIVYFSKYFQKELWHWKFDDFILCFKNGINKHYGDIYGEFNVSVFMKWVEQYEKEKDDFFYNKHLDTKEATATREDTKHMIFNERQKTGPLDIELPKRMGGIIADENYFNPKK